MLNKPFKKCTIQYLVIVSDFKKLIQFDIFSHFFSHGFSVYLSPVTGVYNVIVSLFIF